MFAGGNKEFYFLFLDIHAEFKALALYPSSQLP